MRSLEVCFGEPATHVGKTRLNKMGHRSSYARLSTLGTTRIDYCEPEGHASIALQLLSQRTRFAHRARCLTSSPLLPKPLTPPR